MHYNSDKRNKVKQLLTQRNYRECKKELDKYLESYPNDDIALSIRVKLLMCDGCLNKAKKQSEKILKYTDSIKNIRQRNGIYLDHIFILLEEEKYDEALEYYYKLDLNDLNRDTAYRLKGLLIYLKKNTNQKIKEKRNQTYYVNQIIKYSRCEAIIHINERHVSDKLYNTLRISLFDLVKLFLELEESLENGAVKAPKYGNVDHYIFDYPNIGVTKSGNSINLIEVITEKNTLNILTMFPCREPIREDLINSIIAEKENKRELKMSQIEKFNKRYNF